MSTFIALRLLTSDQDYGRIESIVLVYDTDPFVAVVPQKQNIA